MLVLHASVINGQLLLWGETPPAGPKRRRTKSSGSAPSPLDPGGDRLLQAITEALPEHTSDRGEVETLTGWLPTAAGRPLASSRLVDEPPVASAKVELAPWTLNVVQLPPGIAVDLLCAAAGRDTLAPGLVVGRTLGFWAEALRVAGALVARQHFLPGLRQQGTTWRACWQPVPLGPETAGLGQLARSMPHACRALSASAEAAPDAPAEAVVRAFLDTFVDHLVRSSVTPAPPPAVAKGKGKGRKASAFESVHDEWLHALRAGDSTLSASAKELSTLAGQVRDWRRPVAVTSSAPFRLCFRLEEPHRDGNGEAETFAPPGTWHLRYLLQANEDPSLLVEVADAWQAKGQAATLLRRASFEPREHLLAALGQAAAVDPLIEASLKEATPTGVDLDVTAAHHFLTEKAWLLEQAGFGVLLPAWWTRKGTKQRLSVRAHVKRPAMQGGSGLALTDLVQFDWQVALGDYTLTLKELEALAKLKVPLVQVRGQWVQLSAEEIQAAVDFWKEHPSGQGTVRDVMRMALGAADAPAGLPLAGITATGAVADLLAQLERREDFEEVPVPDSFQGTLRPYQGRGYSWLAFLRRYGLGGCLADDMGLGKTVQTLALLERQWPKEKKPSLLVCPTSVVSNWLREAARFTPGLPVLVHHGVTRKKGPAFAKEAEEYALILSSYSLLHRDAEVLKQVPWAAVILDEAQNVKNPQTKQSQAARSLPAEWRLALTGTPVENHVGDLWALFEFLHPGFLGSQAAFKRNFFVPIQAQRDADAAARLKRLTSPFVLRRLKTDKDVINDLPDKLEMKVYCTLTKEQASLYAAVVEEASKAIADSEGIQRRGNILGTLSRLKQVCNHPAQFLGDNSAIADRSGKVARLTEMLEEALEADDRALVFTQFTEMGAILQRHLQDTFGREVSFLHGGLSRKQRDDVVGRFQLPDGPAVLLLSLKAGGTGLNLTAANHVFHFDRWWNPAVEDQATDRAFRIGQTRKVQVHKFVCAGTLEERIDDMISRKQQVAGLTVGAGEAWLTELSTAELKEIFALRQEAIGE
ncbi:MAG: DEAD/DEAH box helicase [Planctomycetes bacterium]|nr:DEAD/DEAH box helicase [Planctomycetota bacterium]